MSVGSTFDVDLFLYFILECFAPARLTRVIAQQYELLGEKTNTPASDTDPIGYWMTILAWRSDVCICPPKNECVTFNE